MPALLFLELVLAATGPVVDQLGSSLLEFCLGIVRGNLNHETISSLQCEGLGPVLRIYQKCDRHNPVRGRSYDVLLSSAFALLVSRGIGKLRLS